MGVFSFFLSVPAAMILHGVTQATANGSRAWLYRHAISWTILPPYLVGAALCFMLFVSVTFIPDKGLLFMLIGGFPFLALCIPKKMHLDLQKKRVSLSCGFVVTLAQMLAGASGPILDIFYQQSEMNRFQILGTKAITQTIGHILKLAYYGVFISFIAEVDWYLYPGVMLVSLGGTMLGKQVLTRMSDLQFRRFGKQIILGIGMFYIAKGIAELSGG